MYIKKNKMDHSKVLDSQIKDKNDLKHYLKINKLLSLSIIIQAHKNTDQLLCLSDTIRTQASLEPSLGIALTMHHHIVLVLAKFPDIFENAQEILKKVLNDEYLIASAFAEGKAGVNIFNPSSSIDIKDNIIRLNGSKKPCTLSSIADYYVMSTVLNGKLTLINLSAKQEGISIQPFWNLEIFKYCDSNELVFNNVIISEHQYCHLNNDELSLCLIYGLSLFNYLVVSAYIGISDIFIKMVPESLRSLTGIKMKLIEFQKINDVLLLQMNSICSKERLFEDDLSCILNLRYLVENNLQQMKNYILDNIGGIEIMKNPIILNLNNHLEMLKYHPTGRFQYYNQFV